MVNKILFSNKKITKQQKMSKPSEDHQKISIQNRRRINNFFSKSRDTVPLVSIEFYNTLCRKLSTYLFTIEYAEIEEPSQNYKNTLIDLGNSTIQFRPIQPVHSQANTNFMSP